MPWATGITVLSEEGYLCASDTLASSFSGGKAPLEGCAVLGRGRSMLVVSGSCPALLSGSSCSAPFGDHDTKEAAPRGLSCPMEVPAPGCYNLLAASFPVGGGGCA